MLEYWISKDQHEGISLTWEPFYYLEIFVRNSQSMSLHEGKIKMFLVQEVQYRQALTVSLGQLHSWPDTLLSAGIYWHTTIAWHWVNCNIQMECDRKIRVQLPWISPGAFLHIVFNFLPSFNCNAIKIRLNKINRPLLSLFQTTSIYSECLIFFVCYQSCFIMNCCWC